MDRTRRSGIVGGLFLILLGAVLLVGQLVPSLWGWVNEWSWPLIVVAVGVFLLILGIVSAAPGMTVPASIVSGIGLLLWWQNATGNWASWAYAWTLIPGFAGIGTFLMGLWTGEGRRMREGAWAVLTSLILFAIFASFLGGPAVLGQYWPALLILLGLMSLGQYFLRARKA